MLATERAKETEKEWSSKEEGEKDRERICFIQTEIEKQNDIQQG